MSAWLEENGERIRQQLVEAGAILIRGARVDWATQLEASMSLISGGTMDYVDRVTPRSRLAGRVVTSTNANAEHAIALHSENAFADSWPTHVLFHCLRSADQGGRTPIADTRQVLRDLPDDLRQRFERLGVRYTRNFGAGPGPGWREAFQVSDPEELETRARSTGVELEWREGGRLRTRENRPAVAIHPVSAERVWFNHAAALHVSAIDPLLREILDRQLSANDLPHQTSFGDGAPITPEDLGAIRSAYRNAAVAIDWRAGDVLLLDNLLVAHGREPYRGSREVVAVLGRRCSWSRIQHSAVPNTCSAAEAKPPPPECGTGSAGTCPPSTTSTRARELVLATIAEIFGRASLSPQDDFFALGGDSIHAARVVARLRKRHGLELPIARFFEAETLSKLAAHAVPIESSDERPSA